MVLKIRLRQQGRRNQYTYRVVITDSRSPRDGKYIEMIGHYNPYAEGKDSIVLQEDRIDYWISKGAQPTEKMEQLIRQGAPAAMKNLREQRAKAQLKKKRKKKEAKPAKVAAEAKPVKAAKAAKPAKKATKAAKPAK